MRRNVRPRTHDLLLSRRQLFGHPVDLFRQFRQHRLIAVDAGTRLSGLVARRFKPLLQTADRFTETPILRERKARPKLPQAGVVLLEPTGLASRQLHAAQPPLHFLDDVVDPQQILLRPIQLALRLALARLVAADPRRLFKNRTTLDRRGVQQPAHTTLLDHRVTVSPNPRIHEQIAHVLKPCGLFVDLIFALARTVELPRDDHLVSVHAQYAIAVLEREVDLRNAAALARTRSVEDHVDHLPAAK